MDQYFEGAGERESGADESGSAEGSSSLLFEAFFQPIICVATGRIAGYEALARQYCSDSSDASPPYAFFDDDVPLGRKRQWDRTVRRQAFREFSECCEQGFLTVNIFPDWLEGIDDSSVPSLDMLHQEGVDPSRVIMEITERDGDLDALRELVHRYQDAGLRVAIDDFGVGASQMDRVIALQPDVIKLDMHLFKAASKGLPEADVLLAVASLAQRAGCEIICEGVETEDELHFAIECGANYVQGWLFEKASKDFQVIDGYCSEMARYKNSYLERKAARHYELATHNQAVIRQVEGLREYCSSYGGGDLKGEELEASLLSPLGIFRVYVCDVQGNQVSSNLDVTGSGFRGAAGQGDFNWSHRPYFPLLHAIKNLGLDHVVASDPYKDVLTDAMCKTYGCFISDAYILLVDAIVDDCVLFKRP